MNNKGSAKTLAILVILLILGGLAALYFYTPILLSEEKGAERIIQKIKQKVVDMEKLSNSIRKQKNKTVEKRNDFVELIKKTKDGIMKERSRSRIKSKDQAMKNQIIASNLSLLRKYYAYKQKLDEIEKMLITANINIDSNRKQANADLLMAEAVEGKELSELLKQLDSVYKKHSGDATKTIIDEKELKMTDISVIWDDLMKSGNNPIEESDGITFITIYKTQSETVGSSFVQTSDGGYFVVGSIKLKDHSEWDVHLAKFDVRGKFMWGSSFGGDNNDYGTSIQKSGKYFIIGATTRSRGNGKDDFWIIKITKTGDIIWDKTFGTDSDEKMSDMKVSGYEDNTHYVAVGTRNFYSSKSIYAVKVNYEGHTRWEREIVLDGNNSAVSIMPISKSDDYLVLGDIIQESGGVDMFLLRLDGYTGTRKLGTTRIYGGERKENASSIVNTWDGGYMIIGSTYSWGAGSSDIWLIKIKRNGNEVWRRPYGTINLETGKSIYRNKDGGYVFVGSKYSYEFRKNKIIAIMTDNEGNRLTPTINIKTKTDDEARYVRQMKDGGYMLTGRMGGNMFIMKTDSNLQVHKEEKKD